MKDEIQGTCRCGSKVAINDRDIIICTGCDHRLIYCGCVGGAADVSKEEVARISEDQPQPHDESISVTSNVRELVRDNTIASRAHYEATRDLFESLENIIKDQETEIRRLCDEQIKPLADYLMQQSDKIGHLGDEGACAMAIRVISELTASEPSPHNDQGNDEEFEGDYIPDDYA